MTKRVRPAVRLSIHLAFHLLLLPLLVRCYEALPQKGLSLRLSRLSLTRVLKNAYQAHLKAGIGLVLEERGKDIHVNHLSGNDQKDGGHLFDLKMIRSFSARLPLRSTKLTKRASLKYALIKIHLGSWKWS